MDTRTLKIFIIFTIIYVIVAAIIMLQISSTLNTNSDEDKLRDTPKEIIGFQKNQLKTLPFIIMIILIISYFSMIARIVYFKGVADQKKLHKNVKIEFEKLYSYEKESYKEEKRRTLKNSILITLIIVVLIDFVIFYSEPDKINQDIIIISSIISIGLFFVFLIFIYMGIDDYRQKKWLKERGKDPYQMDK